MFSVEATVLPELVRGWLDRQASALLQPADADRAAFAEPAGEAALAAPGSVAWQVFKNPVTMLVGGIAAVLLELAEPRVRDGVWRHTTFRTDPVRRLQRTGLAAMLTVYGPRSKAEAMIAGVRRAHGRIEGRTEDGVAYRADDPALLDWVQATASFGFLEAYGRYVRPLGTGERDRFLIEAMPAARLYGACGAPASAAALEAHFARMRPMLAGSAVVSEFLAIMQRAPMLPRPLGVLQGALVRGAVAVLPGWARELLGLGAAWGLRPWEPRLLRTAAGLAERTRLDGSPAVQSCVRLGLPPDFLYRPARP